MLAADRAVRIAAERDFVELGGEGVEEQQASCERLACAERELQRLACLERADDARQHPEHSALGAARRELGWRRLREEAAIARALVRLEHRHLALEAIDGSVNDRDAV